MSLTKMILISVGICCVVWIGVTLLPGIFQVFIGRSTGVAFSVPQVFRALPRILQIPATLLGPPLVVGLLGGYLWHFFTIR